MKKKLKLNAKAIHQAAFLKAYRQAACIRKAARLSKIARTQHYEWLRKDAAYAEQFGQAHAEVLSAVEDEIIQRAAKGYREPLVYQGEFTYPELPDLDEDGQQRRDAEGKLLWTRSPKPRTIKRFSENAAFFVLRHGMPEKYGNRTTVDVTGEIEIVERLNAARKRLQQT